MIGYDDDNELGLDLNHLDHGEQQSNEDSSENINEQERGILEEYDKDSLSEEDVSVVIYNTITMVL